MQWKEINGYEGYYEVSDTGLVRSLERYVPDKSHGKRFVGARTMKQSDNSNLRRGGEGYLVVNLHKQGKSNVVPVHRLVAEAFIPNPDNLPTINHKDGDKHNNALTNLEWASYADNNIHALANNLRQPRGKQIMQIELNGTYVATYRSACEASRVTGIGRGVISHCVNHRINSAGGYLWKKVEECNDYSGDGSTVEDELPLEAQEL